ncbi:MAG: type IV pilin protein [Pirellulaceae bacterium]
MKIRRSDGFTLIELMIVVVVVAVLAAIAFPAYTNQVQKARRADATTALLGAAQQLERCFTRFNAYNADDCPDSFATEGGFYVISIARDATSFTLTAAPQGAQAGDTACGTFTLDHRGNRTPLPDANRCWGN